MNDTVTEHTLPSPDTSESVSATSDTEETIPSESAVTSAPDTDVSSNETPDFTPLKIAVEQKLAELGEDYYDGGTLLDAKRDRGQLNRLKSAIETRRSTLKRGKNLPDTQAAALLTELISLVDKKLVLIREFIESEETEERKKRKQDIAQLYRTEARPLGAYAQAVKSSPAFFEHTWENPSYSLKHARDEMRTKIAEIAKTIEGIRASVDSRYTAALIDRYLSNLRLEGLGEYCKRLSDLEEASAGGSLKIDEPDRIIGYQIIRISGNAEKIRRANEQLALLGVSPETVENGMPDELSEVTEPTFDSFVSFDLETSGSFGSAVGDIPSEITEIGAVKVENGVITERFSELCNPGRVITPRVIELTGITDDMVREKPPVAEVLARFAEFAGKNILVGHGIKTSDIHYVSRAAHKSGLVMDNTYLDTLPLSSRLKTRCSLTGFSLDALIERFSIVNEHSHRALGDAEATAKLYLAMRDYILNPDKPYQPPVVASQPESDDTAEIPSNEEETVSETEI